MIYDNYIFDLYGTLVDIRTNEHRPELWKRLALFYGYYDAFYTPEELRNSYFELVGIQEADLHEAHPEIQIEHVFAALFSKKGVSADEALAVHAGQFFRILSTEHLRLYAYAAQLLEALRTQGSRVYLLSNAQRIFTEYELHTLGIMQYFDDIFISSDYGMKKPDPRFFHILIDKHQIDPERAIMIGNDGANDINGAKAVGLHTCYIRSAVSPKEELPEADYVLQRMDLRRAKKLLT